MADQGTGHQRPAGWKKDPTGRHFGRYWDGEQWTHHVISAEKVQSLDPLPPRAEPSRTPATPVPDRTQVLRTHEAAAPQVESPTTVMRSSGGVLIARHRSRQPSGALASVQAWPRWAKWTVGVVAALMIVGWVGTLSEDQEQPISVVGNVETTLTEPASTAVELATTVAPPATAPPVTEPVRVPTTPATTPAPVATTPAIAPAATAPATTQAPSVQEGVRSGSFCAPGGAKGVTSTGLSMTCTSTADDERNRWRAS